MKVLAVSSGGGHWIELLRVLPAFDGHEIHYATVNQSYSADVDAERFSTIKDATRASPLAFFQLVVQLALLTIKLRPSVVVSTGAAPGLVALMIGKIVGAKTVWIDSIANVDELSGSGAQARRCADLWLTQWPHLAKPDGPEYAGKVL